MYETRSNNLKKHQISLELKTKTYKIHARTTEREEEIEGQCDVLLMTRVNIFCCDVLGNF